MLILTTEELTLHGFSQCAPGRWGKKLRSTAIHYHKQEHFNVPMPRWSFGDWMHELDIETVSDLLHFQKILGKHIPREKSTEQDGKDKEKL